MLPMHGKDFNGRMSGEYLDATKAPHDVKAVRGFLMSAHLAHGDMQVPADPSSYWLVGLHHNFGNGYPRAAGRQTCD